MCSSNVICKKKNPTSLFGHFMEIVLVFLTMKKKFNSRLCIGRIGNYNIENSTRYSTTILYMKMHGGSLVCRIFLAEVEWYRSVCIF